MATKKISRSGKFVAGDSVEYAFDTIKGVLWVPAIIESVNLKTVRISYRIFGQERMLSVSPSKIRHI